MTDWFLWNGHKCTEYGIHVSEHPAITIPAERSTFTSVPGRSGSLTKLEGDAVYDDMLLSCTCWIENTNDLPRIAAWLRGSGTVTFANRQGGFYYARVVNQIPFEKILRGHPNRSFAVTFRCQPMFFLNDNAPITVVSTGTFIENKGWIISVSCMVAGAALCATGAGAAAGAGLIGVGVCQAAVVAGAAGMTVAGTVA